MSGLLAIAFKISDSLSHLDDQSFLIVEFLLQLEVFVLERVDGTVIDITLSGSSLDLLGFFILELNQLVQSLVVESEQVDLGFIIGNLVL